MSTTLSVDGIIPFAFLDAAARHDVARRLRVRTIAPRAAVVDAEDRGTRAVFVVLRGSVDVTETADEQHGARHRTVTAGHTFGERAAILEQPYPAEIVAGGAGAEVGSLPGAELSRLVDASGAFAQAVASVLIQRQRIFDAHRRLHAKILSLIGQRRFFLAELLPYYTALRPALHPGLAEPELDVDALQYACVRLPAEVTRTTAYFLTEVIPPLYHDPDSKFDPIPAGKARRRSLWRVIPGKLLVLVRDLTDLTDLLTCLCLYAVEARKLRRRIRSDETLRGLAACGNDPQAARALIDDLPLAPAERAGLMKIWPADTAERLRDVLLHHEDIAFEVRRSVGDYNARASENWITQLRGEAAKIVDLDRDLDVHVISSNTHSVGNCLSPFLARHRDEILEWGRLHARDLAAASFARRADLLYVTAARWLAHEPLAARRREDEELASGRRRLVKTAFTGIEVDLIDARRLRPDLCDEDVAIRVPDRPTLLVNVDFAFGEQADEILAGLIALFGRSIRSINVLGKAGALGGQRGDLLLPHATLLQTTDELYRLSNPDLRREDLEALAPPGRKVHEGPILTVAGTLLQDRAMLLLYKKAWRCIGLEMEGSYFARRVAAAIELGLLAPDVRTRFAYYVSDAPLDPKATLARSLRPEEGVPPLYAITRAILRKILG